jgi:hypothetical protein
MQTVTVTLSVAEIAAIAARAEVERTLGERGVWSKLWERIKKKIGG